jgi:hypothetical protein
MRYLLHIGAAFCASTALILGRLRGALPIRINAELRWKPLREFCAQWRRVRRTHASRLWSFSLLLALRLPIAGLGPITPL